MRKNRNFPRASVPATVDIQADIRTRALVWGNAVELDQVVMNLGTNAAHAMQDDGGVLGVTVTDFSAAAGGSIQGVSLPAGDYVRIAVSDTGSGIRPEDLGAVFDPYFTTKGPGQGSGLGLALVQGIVENCGGRVTVSSTWGRGSVFTVYLPVTREQAEPAPDEEVSPVRTRGRILLVDDEPLVTEVCRRNLENWGYTVTTTNDSRHALELFAAAPDDFDLVMTDLTMPNLTGAQLAGEMRKISPAMPILLLSGYGSGMSADIARDSSISAFASKPLVKDDLARLVSQLIVDGHRAGSFPPGAENSC